MYKMMVRESGGESWARAASWVALSVIWGSVEDIVGIVGRKGREERGNVLRYGVGRRLGVVWKHALVR